MTPIFNKSLTHSFLYRVAGDKKPLEMEVTGLEPGHQYKFRVTAVNDEGDSEPLETERAILAKNPFGKLSWHFKLIKNG